MTKVLFAGKFVPSGGTTGGLQSWIATVRKVLEDLGAECFEWQHGWDVPNECFDLGIVANLSESWKVLGCCSYSIGVSHGIIDAESPRKRCLVNEMVYVSEGVREYWGDLGARVIPQPVDTDFWYMGEGSPRNGELVRFSYRRSQTMCKAVAANLGLGYQHLSDVTQEEARNVLSCASVVCASGRAALEAMSCGAPTVIYDYRSSYQGPLLDVDLTRQQRNSYSGRGGIEPKFADLKAAILEARPNRQWVVDNHCAKKVVKELIRCAPL